MTTDTRPATGRAVLTALASLLERYPDLDCPDDAVVDLLDEVVNIVRNGRAAVRRARPPAERPEQEEAGKVQEKDEPAAEPTPKPEQPTVTDSQKPVAVTWPTAVSTSARYDDTAMASRVAAILVSDTRDGAPRRFVPEPEPAPKPSGWWERVLAWVERHPMAMAAALLVAVAGLVLVVALSPAAGTCAAMVATLPRYGGRRDKTLTRDETRRVARELNEHAQTLRERLIARTGDAAREMTVDFKRGVEHAATLLEHRATELERRGLAAT